MVNPSSSNHNRGIWNSDVILILESDHRDPIGCERRFQEHILRNYFNPKTDKLLIEAAEETPFFHTLSQRIQRLVDQTLPIVGWADKAAYESLAQNRERYDADKRFREQSDYEAFDKDQESLIRTIQKTFQENKRVFAIIGAAHASDGNSPFLSKKLQNQRKEGKRNLLEALEGKRYTILSTWDYDERKTELIDDQRPLAERACLAINELALNLSTYFSGKAADNNLVPFTTV